MIQKLSSLLVKWLVQSNAISQEDYKLFHYAIYSFLWGLTPLCISITLGLFSGMLFESTIMIIPIIILRRFSGGYHLDSARKCIFFSTIVLALALFLVRAVILLKCKTLLTSFVTISTISICHNSPIDSEARKLSEHEYRAIRKVAHIAAFLFYAVYIAFLISNQVMVYSALGIGVIVPGLLQIPCLAKDILDL